MSDCGKETEEMVVSKLWQIGPISYQQSDIVTLFYVVVRDWSRGEYVGAIYRYE